MTVVYIHGASATSESFNYIREHIKEDEILIDYNSAHGFNNNLQEMKEDLTKENNLFFVAHSLGGIYALHLANQFYDKTIGGVTLSTPYGGSSHADFAKYFLPFSQLMRDIGPMDKPMAMVSELKLPKNWTNVVTTKGQSPWIRESNDGVVTIKSMKYRTDMNLIEIDVNHYEVMLSNKTIDIIKDKLKLSKK